MNSEELFRIFEIETIEEFCDFEQISILMEDDENVDEDMFYEILIGIEDDTFFELIDVYFEDVKQGIPDDATDIYAMFSNACENFKNRLRARENNSDKMLLIDEIYRFRQWYLESDTVTCVDKKNSITDSVSICEALVRFREEKLSEGVYEYDFSLCESFETEEFLEADYEDYDDYEKEDDDDKDEDDEYSDGLINKNHPVIDNEDYEDEEDNE